MARTALVVTLAVALIAAVAGQEVAPVTPQPGAAANGPQEPMLINMPIGTPTPAVAAPAPPPIPPVVTPEELLKAKNLIASVFNSSQDQVASCDRTKLIGDYYALSVVNCDRAQADSRNGGVPITECPAACATGVTAVGATCTADFNYAYVKTMATNDGPGFNLSSFDPYNALELCKVTFLKDKVAEAYTSGQTAFLLGKLQGVALPACDAAVLQSPAFIEAKTKCDADSIGAGCPPTCTQAIDVVGEPCLDSLAAATNQVDPALYAVHFKSLEACGISWQAPVPVAAPEVAPAPAASVTPAAVVPAPPAPSSAGVARLAVGAAATVVAALLMA